LNVPMDKHTHKYFLQIVDGNAEMLCECGKNITSIYTGPRLVDYEVVQIADTNGTVLYEGGGTA
jgi:hypothetical protein